MSLNNRWGQKKEKDLNERLSEVLRDKNNVDGDDKHFIDNLIRSLTNIGSEVWTAAGFRTPHASEEWKRTQKDWFDGECDKIKATINHKSSTFDADLNSLQSAVQKLIDGSAFDECPGMDTFIDEEKKKRNEYLFKKEGNKLLIQIDETGDSEGFQKRLEQLENDLVQLEKKHNLTRDDNMKKEIKKMQHLLQVKQFNEACNEMLTALDPKSASFESDIKTLEQKWSNLLTKYKETLENDVYGHFSPGKKNSELVETYIKEMKEEWNRQKQMCDDALQHSGWKKSDSLIPQEEINDKRNAFKQTYEKDCYNDDKLNEEIQKLDEEDRKYNEAQQKYEDEQKQKYSQKFCDNILANIPPEVTSADFESEMDKPMREVENNIRKGKGQEPCGEETSYIMGVPTIFPCPVPNDVKANTCSNYDNELDKRKERENLIKEREEILNQTDLTSSQLREKIQGLKNIQGDKAIQELTTQLNNRIIELEKEEQLELLKGFSKKITDTPPEGISYSKTLEVYKNEWDIFSNKYTWQNNNNEVNSSVKSIATKIEEFDRHKTKCDSKFKDIYAEWNKLGANYVLPDMGDCIIDGMQQKLDSIQSDIDLEKKQFEDIANGTKSVSKSQLKQFLKHKDRIPENLIGKLEELSERADSILQIIGQQFSVLKTVVDTYLSEKGEYDKNVTERETQQKEIEERLMKATAQIQENMGTLKEKTDLCNQQPQDLI